MAFKSISSCGQVSLDCANQFVVALNFLDQECVEWSRSFDRQVLLVHRLGHFFWDLILKLDHLLAVVLEDHLRRFVSLVFQHACVHRTLDNELILVGAGHNVCGEICSSLLSGALVQTKDLRQVIVWEVAEGMILHVIYCLDQDWHHIVANLVS